ncbi:hypothetical protein LX99_01788 [Mucilaginibacter oryzae]|uniref:NlpE-like protein n=2 Tax=Mucilaginibacter oryzae TaxID=468058 RepID=A0A316HGZ4_9SPHI|nr:hypothetical protein LX99_01788 [Mucilaginibacter oryzae]
MFMLKLRTYICIFLVTASACQQAKNKPASKDSSKTSATVADKTDSVINNPTKKYGSATVPDPCVKCLLEVVKDSKSYKESTENVSEQNIGYTINWVTAIAKNGSAKEDNKTNAIRIDVKKDEDGEATHLCSYMYNNVNGTMFVLTDKDKYQHEVSGITPAILKKIRNSCYWGVASAK